MLNYASWKDLFVDHDIDIELNKVRTYINPTNALENKYPKPKKVYYDNAAGITVVLWKDNTKTIVKAAKDDAHDAYLGYCAALAKKIHGTNSALKRDLEKVLVIPKKKEKKYAELPTDIKEYKLVEDNNG